MHPDEDFSKELDGNEHVPQLQIGAVHNTGTNQSIASELGVNQTSTFEPGLYVAEKRKTPDRGAPGSSAAFIAASPETEDEPFTSRWPSDVLRAMRDNAVSNPADHYYGQSSGARFFNTALMVRSEAEGGTDEDVMQRIAISTKDRPDFWKPHPVLYSVCVLELYADPAHSQWEVRQFRSTQQTCFVFPDPDLFAHLIEVYFSTSHLICPILHRGTFEADIAAGKHLTDEAFGSVVEPHGCKRPRYLRVKDAKITILSTCNQ